jgi:hypothetical protein
MEQGVVPMAVVAARTAQVVAVVAARTKLVVAPIAMVAGPADALGAPRDRRPRS